MELLVNSPSELDAAVEALLAFAAGRRIFTFTGEIGAGKTTFIQAICRRFGVEDAVTSPTFALVNEYRYAPSAPEETGIMYHLDLYRMEDMEEALDIGIEDILGSGAYCLIEWPELIEPLLPEDTVRIKMEIVKNSVRKILFLHH